MRQNLPFSDAFKTEAEELLVDIEDCALDLEQNPNETECVNRLFRSFHTLKGSGAMFGFDEISSFTHHIESVLDRVREGKLAVSGELIGLILVARDKIKTMIDAKDGECQTDSSSCEAIVEKFKEILPKEEKGEPGYREMIPDQEPAKSGREKVWRIRFRPDPDIFKNGADPLLILGELEELGEMAATLYTGEIPPLEELEADRCYVSWDILLTTGHGEDEIRDVFIFVEPESEVRIRELDENTIDEDDPPRIGEILMDRGDTSAENLAEALKGQKRIGEILTDSGEVPVEKIDSALAEQELIAQRKSADASAGIRVLSEKLDRLVNLVGELVVTKSRLSQLASEMERKELSDTAEQIERLSDDLRDCALEMRMVPVGTLFGRFRRLVRDLSGELDKKIDLVIEGGETELDKTIVERLNDPLVHLIRNSIDHGIRTPEERMQNGKPETGTVRLVAEYEGPRAIITVSDDGMGVDAESIRKTAIERDLIPETAELAENELLSLMFLPGFSTATEVTSVSGRGVGMDVVKKQINTLGGTIKVRSRQGRGTTFRLSLPLTLAIIEGLSVISGGRHFVVPIEMIDGCTDVDTDFFDKSNGRNMIQMAGGMIPFIRLREIFNFPETTGGDGHIVIADAENIRLGIVVDEILGNIQTVIKPLDRLYRNAPGISGASIMGDGSVALIVDVPGIIQRAKRDERNALRDMKA